MTAFKSLACRYVKSFTSWIALQLWFKACHFRLPIWNGSWSLKVWLFSSRNKMSLYLSFFGLHVVQSGLTFSVPTISLVNVLQIIFCNLCSFKHSANVIHDNASERQYYINESLVRSLEHAHKTYLTKKNPAEKVCLLWPPKFRSIPHPTTRFRESAKK